MNREMLYAALIVLLLPISTQAGVDVFNVPPNRVMVQEEGSDFLLSCLPTILSATNLTLRMADGSALPPDLKFTVDPRRGIVIRAPRPSHSGEYVCSVLVNAARRDSPSFHINVMKKVRVPPAVSVEVDECVRVVGEKLQLTCNASNHYHSFTIKWQHSSNQTLQVKKTVKSSSNMVQVMSVVTLPHVNKSDAGNLTCIATNTAGKNSTTVSLRIAEKPYVSLTPLKPSGLKSTVELMEGETLELRVEVDAYPTIQDGRWSTPRATNTSTYEETLVTIHRSYRQVASLSIKRIRADESGWYSFNARGANINATTHIKVYVYQKPSVVIEWRNGSLTCLASGYPALTVYWQQCEKLHNTYDSCDRNTSSVDLLSEQYTLQQHDDFQPHTVRSVLLTRLHNTTAECVAVNTAGVGRSAISLPPLLYVSQPPPDVWTSRIFLTIVTATSVTATLLFILLGVCVYRCKQKPKYEIRWKIIEVSDGNNYTYIDPTQLPYNTKWEFPRDRLTFGQVLGSGAFGKVVEATALGLEKDDHVTQVAVKMLKSSAHSEEKEALMCELKILSHLGSHANIVNLLGACTHGGPVLLITEFCSHGDLLNFLRRKAPCFINSVFDTHEISHIYKNLREKQNHERRDEINSYMDMQPGQRSRDCTQGGKSGGQSDVSALNMDRLLRFSAHVAQGMNFLASKNCIHRDVAARNVLVSDSLVAKICDFGLARDIMNDSNYVVRGNARLPVKWMSPESIFECLYTVQSDVWSYGILLWEIFSLGRSPYPDMVVDARFYKMIRCGYHMSQPDFAPAEMYQIMKMCWSLEPTSRPTFSRIAELIRALLPENSEQQQQQYQNIQQEISQTFESLPCVKAKTNDNHHDKTPEEQRPLTHSNNYQLY
ncbi:macrophage colony-stimulating factor 1 receptor 1 isoform X1 [Pangasianodon hypophthalmus]|uniref:macrophage colony-stimulating factor 1 receptor 1 isoform X1 n=1 Tax=Pangasianodon hypophthalmus TaxID=310915 RepID=UPI0023078FDF|nr:macrophage colony-stimulating factor 1 receptor 1 isoform X1 [Pangasianodon hypophthalmus]